MRTLVRSARLCELTPKIVSPIRLQSVSGVEAGGFLDFELSAVDPVIWAMILGVGVVAGVINTIVGGGTLLVLPLLIEVVQIPPHIANGTNRLCVAFQAAVALWALSRSRPESEGLPLGQVLRSMPWITAGLVGFFALPGAWLASFLPAEELRKSLGFLVLVAVSFFMFSGSRRKSSESDSEPPQDAQFFGYGLILSSIACGVYGGFIGAGIGAFIILMFTTAGVNIEKAVRWKVFLVWLLSTISGVYYLWAGHFSLMLALPLLLAYAIGGFLGGRWISQGGERWLKPAVGIISAVLAMMMLF